MEVVSFLAVAVGIGALISLHELGHLWSARRSGIAVLRFSVGVGPVLWARWIGKTKYQICMYPVAGFVELVDGTDGEAKLADRLREEGCPERDIPYFLNPKVWHSSATEWQRLKLAAAGPIVNFAVGFLLLFAFLAIFGTPSPAKELRVAFTQPGQPAHTAGLRSGDTIVGLNGKEVTSIADVVPTIERNEFLVLDVVRDGQPRRVEVQPVGGKIGFGEVWGSTPIGIGAAFVQAFHLVESMSTQQAVAIGGLFTGQTKLFSLQSVIGATQVGGMTAQNCDGGYLMVLAGISIGLGIVNLFPIPVLDGFTIVVSTVRMIHPKILPQSAEKFMRLAWGMCLFGLIALLMARDLFLLFV